MGGNPVGNKGHDGFSHLVTGRLRIFEHDDALGNLASLFIGDRYHRCISNIGVGDQYSLKFSGADLLGLVLDQFPDPVDDKKEPVVVHVAYVS